MMRDYSGRESETITNEETEILKQILSEIRAMNKKLDEVNGNLQLIFTK